MSIAAMLVMLTSCVKVEDGFENTGVVNTSREFAVTNFLVNGAENKDIFKDWSFQFGSNQRLQAVKAGLVWQAEWRQFGDSIVVYDFTEYPLTLLNRSWGKKIVNTEMIYTERADGAGATSWNLDAIK
jgi:hypothetical protein